MLLDITRTDDGFKLTGELDLATVELLTDALCTAKPGRPLLLDFSEVSFMDSSGLRVLLATVRNRNGDGPVQILRPTPQVRRVFDITLPDGAPGLEVRS